FQLPGARAVARRPARAARPSPPRSATQAAAPAAPKRAQAGAARRVVPSCRPRSPGVTMRQLLRRLVDWAIRRLRPRPPVMAGGSQLGFAPFSLLLVLGVAGAFLAARRPMEAGILTAAAAGSAVLASGFQSLHARPRPEVGVLRVTSELPYYSFPSGHTIMYA